MTMPLLWDTEADLEAVPPIVGTVLGIDTVRVSKDAPITSHIAADASAKSVVTSKQEVLIILGAYGPLTEGEVVEKAKARGSKKSESRMRSAVKELERDGFVEFSGFYRNNENGLPCQVWQLIGGEAA